MDEREISRALRKASGDELGVNTPARTQIRAVGDAMVATASVMPVAKINKKERGEEGEGEGDWVTMTEGEGGDWRPTPDERHHLGHPQTRYYSGLPTGESLANVSDSAYPAEFESAYGESAYGGVHSNGRVSRGQGSGHDIVAAAAASRHRRHFSPEVSCLGRDGPRDEGHERENLEELVSPSSVEAQPGTNRKVSFPVREDLVPCVVACERSDPPSPTRLPRPVASLQKKTHRRYVGVTKNAGDGAPHSLPQRVSDARGKTRVNTREKDRGEAPGVIRVGGQGSDQVVKNPFDDDQEEDFLYEPSLHRHSRTPTPPPFSRMTGKNHANTNKGIQASGGNPEISLPVNGALVEHQFDIPLVTLEEARNFRRRAGSGLDDTPEALTHRWRENPTMPPITSSTTFRTADTTRGRNSSGGTISSLVPAPGTSSLLSQLRVSREERRAASASAAAAAVAADARTRNTSWATMTSEDIQRYGFREGDHPGRLPQALLSRRNEQRGKNNKDKKTESPRSLVGCSTNDKSKSSTTRAIYHGSRNTSYNIDDNSCTPSNTSASARASSPWPGGNGGGTSRSVFEHDTSSDEATAGTFTTNTARSANPLITVPKRAYRSTAQYLRNLRLFVLPNNNNSNAASSSGGGASSCPSQQQAERDIELGFIQRHGYDYDQAERTPHASSSTATMTAAATAGTSSSAGMQKPSPSWLCSIMNGARPFHQLQRQQGRSTMYLRHGGEVESIPITTSGLPQRQHSRTGPRAYHHHSSVNENSSTVPAAGSTHVSSSPPLCAAAAAQQKRVHFATTTTTAATTPTTCSPRPSYPAFACTQALQIRDRVFVLTAVACALFPFMTPCAVCGGVERMVLPGVTRGQVLWFSEAQTGVLRAIAVAECVILVALVAGLVVWGVNSS